MTKSFDVVVIGAGPAGYIAAVRCAQLGLNVACVDDWRNQDNKPSLGGTCLNVGCIPSKALLESSELFEQTKNEYADHGIVVKDVKLDLASMMGRKNKIVSGLTQGIAGLLKSYKISVFHGKGKLLAKNQVQITEPGKDSPQVLDAKNVILAAGSIATQISAAPLTKDLIVDSAGALEFNEVPKRLGVIGAGVIGLELGSVWRRLGAQVILLEAQETFLPMADEQIAKDSLRHFASQGLDIRLGARVLSCQAKSGKVDIEYQDQKGKHQEQVDKLIVAVGRRPNTDGLFDEESGLLLDEWGVVHVDEQCRTNLPGVYAVGDLVRGPMLAHKGSEEGVMVAEIIAGHRAQVNYDTVPSVIYTLPEIAWVGKTEQTLKSMGAKYKSGVFPFSVNSRARAMGNTAGMIKILADADTDRILGVHMVGPHVSELIALGVVAMEYGGSSEDIALTIFSHPTLSEAFHEAALAVDGRALNIGPPSKRR